MNIFTSLLLNLVLRNPLVSGAIGVLGGLYWEAAHPGTADVVFASLNGVLASLLPGVLTGAASTADTVSTSINTLLSGR